jgi:hypothetical protein
MAMRRKVIPLERTAGMAEMICAGWPARPLARHGAALIKLEPLGRTLCGRREGARPFDFPYSNFNFAALTTAT